MSDMTSALAADYAVKPEGYFSHPRLDIVARLRTDATSAILELGCADGATGRAAFAAGKAGTYVGIEITQPAASIAEQCLSQVLIGDVQALDLAPLAGRFDALIMSEVLEHLVEPWEVLKRLSACLKPGAEVYASSPNVAHHRIILRLLAGKFEYEPMGIMDRTHLRWFTPKSFARMFEAADIAVDEVRPLRHWSWYTRSLQFLFAGRLAHLYTKQIMLIGHKRRPLEAMPTDAIPPTGAIARP